VISRVLIKKQPGRRWLKYAAGLGLLVMTLGVAGSALAVHDLSFQLDGDVNASTTTSVGGNTQAVDWDSIFTAAGANKSPLPTGFTAAKFDRDFGTNPGCSLTATTGTFCTSDDTTFATGSKDTLPISGWQCNHDSNVNSKIDIMNAYSAAFKAANNDEIIYFALERNTNTGDGNVGFWFLQDEVNCASPAGSTTFTGAHRDGDLLIVSAFTNGGSVSTIDVYRWNGGANGSLGTTSVAHGVDCKSTSGADTACATVNGPTNGTGGTITTPWLTSTKTTPVGHSLQISDFFEGGLNLTKSGLAGKCFNVFIGDTRSSQSLTATLFDYARGRLGECSSTTVTQSKDSGGSNLSSATIPATGTLDVKDTATITVTGADTWSGTVSFYLCGPSTTSISSCSAATGTQIGSAQSISANGSKTSDTAQLTSAGYYCWTAVFSGDSANGVPGSNDDGTNECFVVNPRQPTLATQATSGPVAFGSKISDTVTLSNTANKVGTGGVGTGGTINTTRGGVATGNITLTAYGPDSCSTVAYGPVSLAANGNNAVGGAGTTFEFTPSAPGLYVFVASYAGDPVNTLGVAATACSSQPSNEQVTVQQIGTDIKTKQSWIPNDTTTVSAEAGNLGSGSVLFELFDNATCDGTALYSEQVAIVGGSASEEVSTSNTGTGAGMLTITSGYADAADTLAGPYSWKVTFTPDSQSFTGSASSCDAEHFGITYTNDSGPGTDLP